MYKTNKTMLIAKFWECANFKNSRRIPIFQTSKDPISLLIWKRTFALDVAWIIQITLFAFIKIPIFQAY